LLIQPNLRDENENPYIIHPVKPPSLRGLLWACLLPFITLALAMALSGLLKPRPVPSVGNGWEYLGARAFASGDMLRAIPLLSLASAGQKLTAEGWLMLGDAYQSVGNPANALLAWQHVGNDAGALERQLGVHRGWRDYAAAITDLQALSALQPEEAGWRYQLGLLLAATQPEQSIPYLRRAAEASTSHRDALQGLLLRIQTAQTASQPAYTLVEAGRALMNLDEWELAAEAFLRATLLRPDYAEAWAFRGEALQHLDIPQGKKFSPGGLDELKLAIQLDPQSFSANLFLAFYWRRQGQLSQAQEILESQAKLDENSAVIQIELGNTLAEKGNSKEALGHFVHATELAPAEPESWLALAGFSVSSPYQVRQVGLPAARKLLLMSPSDPQALDLMGQALFQLEDPLNAERFFRRAILASASYAPARLHLAQVYLLRSVTSAARQELSLVIQLAPGSTEADFARRLLQTLSP